MLDKENLSKHKYVWGAKKDLFGNLIVERWAIIYINSKWLYYKVPGKDELEYCRTESVFERFTPDKSKFINQYYFKLFWENPKNSQKYIENYEQYTKMCMKRDKVKDVATRLNSAREQVRSLENLYVRVQIELDEMKEQFGDAEFEFKEKEEPPVVSFDIM